MESPIFWEIMLYFVDGQTKVLEQACSFEMSDDFKQTI
jgi:hypothetical protein